MGKDSKLLGAVGRNRVRENGESPPHPIKNLLFVPSSFILQRSENPLLFWISLILDKIKLSKNSILFMKYVFGFFFCGVFSCLFVGFCGFLLFFGLLFFFSVLFVSGFCFVLFSWKMQMLPSVKNAAQQIFQSLLSLVL